MANKKALQNELKIPIKSYLKLFARNNNLIMTA